jgi:hypothetical protein
MSEILRGRRAISVVMARRLGRYFGVEPEFWLALQAAHDLQNIPDGEAGSTGLVSIPRCAALEGRAFIVRETRSNSERRWEVLITAASRGATITGDKPGKNSRSGKSDDKGSLGNKKKKNFKR